MNVPAGETGQELAGDVAAAALQHAFANLPLAKPRRISPSAIDTHREGRWIVLHVRWKGGGEVTVKLTSAWAAVLRNHLTKVLGK